MARGGRRQGRSGAKYPNRSDLQTGQRLPVQAPSGGSYGSRTQLEEAQRAVPLRAVGGTGVAQPATGAAPTPAPVALPPLDAPTENPTEPVTAGSAFGDGPGPEALGIAPTRLSELLDQLPATGDLADLRLFARQRGL